MAKDFVFWILKGAVALFKMKSILLLRDAEGWYMSEGFGRSDVYFTNRRVEEELKRVLGGFRELEFPLAVMLVTGWRIAVVGYLQYSKKVGRASWGFPDGTLSRSQKERINRVDFPVTVDLGTRYLGSQAVWDSNPHWELLFR